MKRMHITIIALLAVSLVLLGAAGGVRLLAKDSTLPVIECSQQELRVSTQDGSDALLQVQSSRWSTRAMTAAFRSRMAVGKLKL